MHKRLFLTLIIGLVAVIGVTLGPDLSAATERRRPTTTVATTSSSTTTTVVQTTQTTTTTIFDYGQSQTAALQADLNDGSLTINSPVSSDGTLIPPAGSVINFGPSGRLMRGSYSTGVAIKASAPDITINNMRVTGSNPCYWTFFNGQRYSQWIAARENQHALGVYPGAERLVVNGLEARDIWGDGLYLGGGNGINVANLSVRCAGRSGISNVNGANVTVTGGDISGVFWWIFNIEPTGPNVVSGYRVSGISVGFSLREWLFSGGPYFNCSVSNVDMRGNLITSSAYNQVSIKPCVSGQILY